MLGLAFIAAALTATSSGAEAAPFRRLVAETAQVGVEEVVGDLLIVGGKVELAGVARGHVYAIDAELFVRSTAVVPTSLTMIRGTLRLEAGAVLPESIDLVGAKLAGPSGEGLKPGGAINLNGAMVNLAPTEPSTVSVALMKSVLPFQRFAPGSDRKISSLRGWDPGLGLKAARFVEDPKELTLGGVARLNFVSGRTEGAFQRGYKGARGSVLFTGIKAATPDAQALYQELVKAFTQAKVSLSVKTALGDGAHWFFKSRGRYVMLWQSGPYVFAVETKLATPAATLFQERQFQDQVLGALSISLGAQP
ncbi:MAG: hypothetical protein IPG45_14245 [Deltaproteobacteria bacterium]|nr:hypothetical protein [Deltaproteobacteria bacterium]